MTNDLEFEIETEGVNREWGIHNGVVVLAAAALVALSILLEWMGQTDLLSGAPLWALSVLSSVAFVLILAAGSVIGMLVGTRMLQAHVGPRGARLLALWGIAALVVSLLLQAALIAVRVAWQTEPPVSIDLAIQVVSYLVTGSIAVGAAMIALAFVGRLRD